MPRARKGGRIYWRNGRAYADFRDYADVGGGREALRPVGSKLATDDKATAEALLTARLGELKQLRKGRAIIGEAKKGADLAAVARLHLERKAAAGKSERWLLCVEQYLRSAVKQFGASRPLTSIAVADLHEWIAALRRLPSKKGGKLAPGTVRHHLNALSAVFTTAQSEDLIPVGHNPVSRIRPGDLPRHRKREPVWLEVPEAAHLLEVARTAPRANANGPAFMYELVATLLLTGGRKAEVAGLTAEDISFDRRTVTFRRHAHRDSFKTERSVRVVPLWPQLAEILGPYIIPADHPPRSGLLFPAKTRGGVLAPVTNFDGSLAALAKRAGLQRERCLAHALRHTWTAARLQTLDRGEPIAPYTVQVEGGWSDGDMIQRIYGHVGTVRHRSPVLEFRRGVVTNAVTNPSARPGDRNEESPV